MNLLLIAGVVQFLGVTWAIVAPIRQFSANAIPIPGRNVPILRLFENYASSCRPKGRKDFGIDQLATLLQSLQMDEMASKVYNSLFFSMGDMQIERFMGKWYTVVDAKKVHPEECSIFYLSMLTQTEHTATFTTRHYAILNGDTVTDEGYGSMMGSEPGEILLTTGHRNDQCPYFPVKLGGLKADGDYEYMILSTPLKYPTMVLTRNMSTFREKYSKEVYDFVEKNGFMSPLAALNTRLHFVDVDVCQKVNKLYENSDL